MELKDGQTFPYVWQSQLAQATKDLKQINLDSQPRLLTNSFKHQYVPS